MNLLKPLIKAGKPAAKVAVKDKPFFSAVDKAALELARTKGTGKEFMTELKKVPGVKPAEIQHRKLEKIEALLKMEKADFLKQLEENPPVAIRESVKIQNTPENLEKLTNENNFAQYFDELSDEDKEMIRNQAATYEDYKLPGGSNYREILLQTPTFGGRDLEDLMSLEAVERHGGIGTRYGEDYLARLRKKRDEMGEPYNSPHWEGYPNVLAHMRVQDRAGPNGEKILHVEEIQSDWHQKGRKHGYYTPEQREEFKQAYKAWKLSDPKNQYGTTRQFIQEFPEYADIALNKVPEAPFKKNWHELAMKRLINYAAENGYDSIAITPGAEQAKRYDLSKHLNEINYGKNPDGTFSLTAVDVNGRPAFNNERLSADELESMVGKEVTQKIIAGEGNEFPAGSVSEGRKSLSGLDLKVGGEGMMGFYDKMIPDYLNSFGKKYGLQVELGGYKLPGDPSLRGEASERLGLAGQRFADMTPEEIEAFNARLDEANAKQLHNFRITPEMREEVTSQGIPLYQEGGAVDNTTPDMSDGGQIIQGDAFKRGGKVHLTDNTDAMFMDLHDKMFKRK